MQPSGGGGGGGGTPFDTRPTFPGQTPQKDKRRSDEGQGPGTVFEFVQGFTPIPNPVARTILSDTSLSPEQQQIHANLMGLRNGGSVGFRPLGYAEGDLVEAEVDLSKLSDAEFAELVAASDLRRLGGWAPRTDIGAMKLNKEYTRRIHENPQSLPPDELKKKAERLRYAVYREGLDQLQQRGGSPSPFPGDYKPATEEQVLEFKSLFDDGFRRKIPEIAVPYAPPVDPTVPPHLEGKAGGGLMGFRPLGYASGGTADADLQRQAEHQNALAMIKFYLGEGNNQIPDQERVGTGTLRALLDAYAKDPEAAIGYWNKLSKLITPGNDMGDLGAISTAPVAPPLTESFVEAGDSIPVEDWDQAREGQRAAEESDRRRIPPPENLTALGRFMHDKFGFDNPPDVSGEQHWSNYAHGGSVPHGTVAGELPRYGNMSVREEGESMGELAKRHKEQDWYNRMRQSPTLGKVRIA